MIAFCRPPPPAPARPRTSPPLPSLPPSLRPRPPLLAPRVSHTALCAPLQAHDAQSNPIRGPKATSRLLHCTQHVLGQLRRMMPDHEARARSPTCRPPLPPCHPPSPHRLVPPPSTPARHRPRPHLWAFRTVAGGGGRLLSEADARRAGRCARRAPSKADACRARAHPWSPTRAVRLCRCGCCGVSRYEWSRS